MKATPGGVLLLLAALGAMGAVGATSTPAQAQDREGWRFTTDPFADLWYHGLAIVGFDGFGRVPLYDSEYAWSVATSRRDSGGPPSELERVRGELATAFVGDPAFEVLHFVPMYFVGTPVDMALGALEHLGGTSGGRADPKVRREAAVLGSVLASPALRATLATFVRALRDERDALTGLGAASGGSSRAASEVWDRELAAPLAGFLEAEGLRTGTVVLTPALGREGRFYARGGDPLVMVAASEGDDAGAVAGAVVRELCYPTVRRALAAYEARLGDRRTLSDVSDLAATRCGAMLLAEHAPGLLAAYRARFAIDSSRAGFLSAAGLPPGVAALEGPIEAALTRELSKRR